MAARRELRPGSAAHFSLLLLGRGLRSAAGEPDGHVVSDTTSRGASYV